MAALIPITIYLNGKRMLVASVADAEAALKLPWPFMDKPQRLTAIRMIDECVAGHLQPTSCIRGVHGCRN